MYEIDYFRSADNELSYSCVTSSENTKKHGVMFVHAANGNRLGPHRMFVELARKFNSLGYPTFRFDLSGCGDSTGDASQNDITSEVLDIVEAVHFFMTKADLEGVILFGISRGARLCYTTMAEHKVPLSAMLLLSIPVSSGSAALKSFGFRLKEYTYKIIDTKRLRKLISGRANFAQICKTLKTALQLSYRYTPVKNKTFASKCPILFIYGKKDPLAAQSRRFYSTRCRENGLHYCCKFIEGANHSFFHYKWKENIFHLSQQWLEKILTGVWR